MTICIGMPLDDDAAFILVDSCAISDNQWVTNVGPEKITRTLARFGTPVVFASAGNLRFSQATKYLLDLTDVTFSGENDYNVNHRAIVKDVIPKLQALMNTHSVRQKDDDPSGMGENDMLIAVGRDVWHITQGFDVVRAQRKFVVIGNATSTSNGALSAFRATNHHVDAPLLAAAAAARICTEFLVGVMPPYYAYTTRSGDNTLHTFPN